MQSEPQRYRTSLDPLRGVARLEIARVQPSDAGDVECRVSNALGVASSRAELLVRRAPRLHVPPALQRDRLNAVRGERLTFELECEAHPWPQFAVFKDGAPLSSDSVRHELSSRAERRIVNFAIEQLTRADSGSYRLVAHNECGTDELAFELHVHELPGRPRDLRLLLLDQLVSFFYSFKWQRSTRTLPVSILSAACSTRSRLQTLAVSTIALFCTYSSVFSRCADVAAAVERAGERRRLASARLRRGALRRRQRHRHRRLVGARWFEYAV